MDGDDRQFLLTTAWLFARHGQGSRARTLCEALVEANPRDGVSAVALAELLLVEQNPRRALEVLRSADCPQALMRAVAVLETRALRALGRERESLKRWQRYLESAKGKSRSWVAGH